MDRELSAIESALKQSNITFGLEALQRLLIRAKSNSAQLRQILDRLTNFSRQLMSSKSYKTAFPLYHILIRLCGILEDHSCQCDLKNNLSFCYRNTGQTSLALKECLEALEIAGNYSETSGKLPALHLNACAIYREDIKDLKIAKTHAELAYFFAKENCNTGQDKEKRTFAVSCYNYALILQELKDLNSSLMWFKEGLKFCQDKWTDLNLEQAFREKVLSISAMDASKRPSLGRKRTVSHKPSSLLYSNYGISRDTPSRPGTNSSRMSNNSSRQGSLRKKPRKKSQQSPSLNPITNITLPMRSVLYEKPDAYNDSESEYHLKTRTVTTPLEKVRNPRYTQDSFRSSKPTKLSLVQSIIKIQRWFRKIKKIPCLKLRFDYVLMALKSFYGVKYFIAVFKQGGEFGVEAWPLEKRIHKPRGLKVSLDQLVNLLGVEGEVEVRKKKEQLAACVTLGQGEVHLKELEVIFEGEKNIEGRLYRVTIWLQNRTLHVQADCNARVKMCEIKLDPLQDVGHVKSKVAFILENLVFQGGQLVFKPNTA